jgi:transposase
MARGRLRNKHDDLVKALRGTMQDHHRTILQQLLALISAFNSSIAVLDEKIEAACSEPKEPGSPYAAAIRHLATISGVADDTAQVMVSELGTDMSRFPTGNHACSWVGVAPGNNESAGKQRSGKTRKGNKALKTALVRAAHSAARTKGTYLSALYHRLVGRRGKKKAIMAVAHSICYSAYHMLLHGTDYHELGADYFDRLNKEAIIKRHIARGASLGLLVTRQPEQIAVAA